MQGNAQANAANSQAKLNKRALALQETEQRDKGEIANILLDLINSSSALNPEQAKSQENQILRTDAKREQDFLTGQQSLPGGGDPRDTRNVEARADLLARQQDLQIRRNRMLDLELLNAKFQALLNTASLGGIRSPKPEASTDAKFSGNGYLNDTGWGSRRRRVKRDEASDRYLDRTA